MSIIYDLLVAGVLVGLVIMLVHVLGCGTFKRSIGPLGCFKASSDYTDGKACHDQD